MTCIQSLVLALAVFGQTDGAASFLIRVSIPGQGAAP